MRPLTDSMILRSPWVTALLVGLLALVTGVPLSALFGDLPLRQLWGVLVAAAAWLVLF